LLTFCSRKPALSSGKRQLTVSGAFTIDPSHSPHYLEEIDMSDVKAPKKTIGAQMREANEEAAIGRVVTAYRAFSAAGRERAAKLMGLVFPPKADKTNGKKGRGPSYEELKADNSAQAKELKKLRGLYALLLQASDLTHEQFVETISNEADAAEEDVAAAEELLEQAKGRKSILSSLK
jgi:hypothetical protein